jgi:RHS repeat-associated protein
MIEQADVLDYDTDTNTSEVTRSFYHINALGSVMEITDMNQATVASYRYDPYGSVTITAGGTPQANDPLGQHWAFTGRLLDAESGLHYYRARYYDSATGRFFQRDPLGHSFGPSLHWYASNNPIMLADPTGLRPEIVRGEKHLQQSTLFLAFFALYLMHDCDCGDIDMVLDFDAEVILFVPRFIRGRYRWSETNDAVANALVAEYAEGQATAAALGRMDQYVGSGVIASGAKHPWTTAGGKGTGFLGLGGAKLTIGSHCSGGVPKTQCNKGELSEEGELVLVENTTGVIAGGLRVVVHLKWKLSLSWDLYNYASQSFSTNWGCGYQWWAGSQKRRRFGR